MKKNLLRLIVAVSALGFLAAGCEKDPKNEGKEDQFINVSPDKIEAGFEEKVTEITVESNCSWTISKTDSEGTAVDWVKCDKTTGKDNTTFNVKVFKNETASARRATVTLASGDTKAFIDVSQGANPNPEKPDDPVIPDDPQPGTDPEPYGDVVKLAFDFTQTPFDGWPTASNYDHTEGGINCVYPLGGRDYTFVLADCGGAAKAQMYWAVDGTPRLAFGAQYRYLGLPAIDGYILCSVACTSVLLNDASASMAPKMAITNKIAASAADAKAITDDSADIVAGGKFQTWTAGGGGTYTYNLTGLAVNTVYYIYALVKGAVSTLELTYYKEGTTPPAPDPGTDPGTGTDPYQPSADAIALSFDFTVTPLEGWPTEAKGYDTSTGKECVYPLEGKDYSFLLTDCGGAANANMFWNPGPPAFLSFNAQYRYLGLPTVEGLRLKRVYCENVYLSTQVPKFYITNKVAASANDAKAITNDSDDVVDGGEFQTWDAAGGGKYTYTLSGTELNTRYYIYAQVKGAVSKLVLTYDK